MNARKTEYHVRVQGPLQECAVQAYGSSLRKEVPYIAYTGCCERVGVGMVGAFVMKMCTIYYTSILFTTQVYSLLHKCTLYNTSILFTAQVYSLQHKGTLYYIYQGTDVCHGILTLGCVYISL